MYAFYRDLAERITEPLHISKFRQPDIALLLHNIMRLPRGATIQPIATDYASGVGNISKPGSIRKGSYGVSCNGRIRVKPYTVRFHYIK
jgi:hypothetical protein